MSHDVTSVNGVAPVGGVVTLPSTSPVAFAWYKTTVASVNLGSITHNTPKNTAFYQNPSYVTMELGTGVSVDRSSSFPLAASSTSWFDEITLPQGEYVMHHGFCGSQVNIRTGSAAWVNNASGSRLSQIVSFRDGHRVTSFDFKMTAPSGGLSLGLRILTNSIALMSYHGFPSTSIVILKVG